MSTRRSLRSARDAGGEALVGEPYGAGLALLGSIAGATHGLLVQESPP